MQRSYYALLCRDVLVKEKWLPLKSSDHVSCSALRLDQLPNPLTPHPCSPSQLIRALRPTVSANTVCLLAGTPLAPSMGSHPSPLGPLPPSCPVKAHLPLHIVVEARRSNLHHLAYCLICRPRPLFPPSSLSSCPPSVPTPSPAPPPSLGPSPLPLCAPYTHPLLASSALFGLQLQTFVDDVMRQFCGWTSAGGIHMCTLQLTGFVRSYQWSALPSFHGGMT